MTTSDPRPGRRKIVWHNAAFLVLTPIAAVVLVTWYGLTVGIHWSEPAACLGLWVATGLAVTAGYHRLFAHRSYRAAAPIRAAFALLGAAAWQNSVIAWAAAHRFHHRHVDSDDDPYNPQEGFFHSHMGWVMVEGPKHDDTSNVPDLWADPICRWQHRWYLPLSTAVNLALALGLGLATGRVWGMLLFALLARVVLTHHFTFLINSAAHMWGSRPWSTAHSARDNWFLSLLTFGEGYHNYHHTFQADYRNGAHWYSWDPTKWLIWTLSKLGLADSLRRSPVDQRFATLFGATRQRIDASFEAALTQAEELGAHAADAFEREVAAPIRARLTTAERRVEEALAELEAARTRWQAAVRAGRRSVPDARDVRRSFAQARRQARRTLQEWRTDAARAVEQLSTARRTLAPG